jgi:hypothetical protein
MFVPLFYKKIIFHIIIDVILIFFVFIYSDAIKLPESYPSLPPLPHPVVGRDYS